MLYSVHSDQVVSDVLLRVGAGSEPLDAGVTVSDAVRLTPP
ncbi:MAG TPA: hypothetical protein VFQ92_07350 [Blastocatellia bacterium]|nr:hypothetical protein [Blastocatellia bacterium]